MSYIRQFDHVGITVADLDSVTAFFADLGLEVEGRTFVEGEFIDTVIGIPDSRTEIVILRPPAGGAGVELASFVRPDHEPGSPTAMANELGLRSICFEVDDLQTAVDGLAANGYGLVGGIGQHENTWRMAHVRAGGNRRLADRADRLTPSGCPLPMRHSAANDPGRRAPAHACVARATVAMRSSRNRFRRSRAA
jgi:catechol 2,3-dioxygenase-like lactoylglutathione lyase family enzyme